MPLCLGASGSVRARQTPHCAQSARDVHTFCPVSFQPPSARTAFMRSEARSDPAPGSLNSWHQNTSPRSVGRQESLDLLAAAVLENRWGGPPSDHQVGTCHTGLGHLLIDQQLFGGPGLPAVRPRPVRCQQPVGQPTFCSRRAVRRLRLPRKRFRAEGARRVELDMQIAPDPCCVNAATRRSHSGAPPRN